MKNYLLGMFLMLFNTGLLADAQTGKISGYFPYSNAGVEIIIFQLDSSVQQGCNTTGRFAMDASTPRFKSTVSAVIAAYHSQSNVKVNYEQTCNVWHNSADANYVCVGSMVC